MRDSADVVPLRTSNFALSLSVSLFYVAYPAERFALNGKVKVMLSKNCGFAIECAIERLPEVVKVRIWETSSEPC